MVRKIVFMALSSFCCLYANGQHVAGVKEIKIEDYKDCSDSLWKHGTNKVIMPVFEIPVLIALSYYPELKGTRIMFVEKSINTTAACRPKWTFLFKSRKNRVYEIYINNNQEKIKGALLEEIPFDAQIGLIGHELGHIADYSKKGVFGIFGMAFQYLFIPGRSKIEKRVDAITIAHNLGWQLYDFEDFIFYRSKVSKEYKAFKRKIYVAPEELRKMIGARGK